jgi:hypothetical protein
MKKCLVCGKDFEPKNPKGKVCSTNCRKKKSRAVKLVEEFEKKNTQIVPPKTESKIQVRNLNKEVVKSMPLGLSTLNQIQWKIDNL